ncbi:hypothetical protein I4U23_000750 [Adineta vaga]|nr:hypothetical protein I4U23_000750 [Adineta vaga]
MQYSYNRLLILIVCTMLIIDHIDAIRVRIPSLRISSTFSKAGDCNNKKKPCVNKNDSHHPAKRIPLRVPTDQKKSDV